MSKVKLDLRAKDFIMLQEFAQNHRDAMVGNTNFPTPIPPAPQFDALLTAFTQKLNQISAAEVALLTLRAERDTRRATLEEALNARGVYVETTSGGVAAKILSAAFEVQAEATPTTHMDKPTSVVATMGDNQGEIHVSCHAVYKARSYIIEQREHSETVAPGPWVQVKISVRSSAEIHGLRSGAKYAFRIRALGPNDLESPWSDEAVCMAP